MKSLKKGGAFLTCLAVSLLAAGCADAPTTSIDAPMMEVTGDDQLAERLTAVDFVESPAGVVPLSTSSHAINIAGVGANFGFAAAAQVIGTGDISGTFTTIGTAAFNAMSVPALRTAFDVLIFTWVSNPAIIADWNTRLVPYMALGGGIVFEDPGQLSDLPPGVFSGGPCSGSGSMTVTAAVPGLTVGIAGAITGAMANNHFCFASWDPALSPFLSHSFIPSVTGLWGRFGAGCIVLTGPDQHFHGNKFFGGFTGNQYRFLVNELDFVSHGCGVLPVDIDIKPGSDPNSINCNNEDVSIAVAILTTDDFDATTVDHTTVTFEGASETHVDKKTGLPRRHEEDVDDDGDTDLVFHFRLGDATDLDCDSTEGTLTGETFDGQAIEGADAVRMIDEGGGQA